MQYLIIYTTFGHIPHIGVGGHREFFVIVLHSVDKLNVKRHTDWRRALEFNSKGAAYDYQTIPLIGFKDSSAFYKEALDANHLDKEVYCTTANMVPRNVTAPEVYAMILTYEWNRIILRGDDTDTPQAPS